MDAFIKFIKHARDCDAALLDIAVRKGMNRAKNDRLNYSKLIRLAAAVMVSAILCVIMHSELFRGTAYGLLRGGNLMTRSGAEALCLHIRDFFDTVINDLGR